MNRFFVSSLASSLVMTAALHAAPEGPSPAETKLRESLRTTMLQLRDAQTERATLQSAQAEAESKLKELSAKVDALTKQAATEQAASRKTIEELTARSTAQSQRIVQLNEALDKWKEGYAKAVEVARAKEAERVKLSDANSVLKRTVEDQRMKNTALIQLVNEVLEKYEKFGLGEALASREPFTRIARARLEAQVEDYQDKALAQRIKADPADPKKTPAVTR